MVVLSKIIKLYLSFSYAHFFPIRFKKKKRKKKQNQKLVQFKLILIPKVILIVLAKNLSWC